MALFKIKRGDETSLPVELKDGYAYFCTDSGNFYIDYETEDGVLERKQVNAGTISSILSDIETKTSEAEAAANTYTDDALQKLLDTLITNGQIGSDTTKTIVNDRSVEPTNYFDNGYTYIKVSDEPVDLNTVQNVTWTMVGKDSELSKEEFTLDGEEGIVQFFTIPGFGNDTCYLVVSVGVDLTENVTKGLYFQWLVDSEGVESPSGVLSLTYNTLTKINPKFYDRLAWSDSELTEIFPAVTFTATEETPGLEAEGSIGLVEGDKYVVNWNDVEYETECVVITEDGVSAAIIGNYSMVGLEDDTGEPFTIAELIGGGIYVIQTNVIPSDNTVSISHLKETIHKVDPKYLYTPDMDAKSGEEGYIANRPMYRISETVELFKDVSIQAKSGTASVAVDSIPLYINTNTPATVTFDGVEYLCKFTDFQNVVSFDTNGTRYGYALGNLSYITENAPNTGEPFGLFISVFGDNKLDFVIPDTEQHTVSMSIDAYKYYADKTFLRFSPITLSFDLSEYQVMSNDSVRQEMVDATEAIAINRKVRGKLNGMDVEVYDISGDTDPSVYEIHCRDDSFDYHIKTGGDDLTITKTLRHPQADHAQNDPTQPDYVKNRLAWTEDTREVVLEEQEVTLVFDGEAYEVEIPGERSIGANEELTIMWDGVEYRLTTVDSGVSYACGIIADQEAPFSLGYQYDDPDNYRLIIVGNSKVSGTHTISITKGDLTIHKIDPKYLPEGGVGYSEHDILGETILSEEALAITNGDFVSGLIGIKEGQEYVVNWNGTEYRCTARSADVGTDTGIFIGNYYFFTQNDADNSGEPFLIGDVTTQGTHAFMTSSGSGTYAITITEFFSEVVHPIDPKFLPTGGFGYTSTELGYIFPETTITVSNNEHIRVGLLGLVEGKEYVVNWNGTEYTCVAKAGTVVDDITGIFIGNYYFLTQTDSDNTGEPFIIGDIAANAVSGFMTSTDGDYTVSIKGDVDTIHKIDQKYIPTVQPDYSQNDYTAPGYIKNKLCYNYTDAQELDTATLMANGAAKISLGNNMYYLKISDYIPPGEWVYNMRVGAYSGSSYNLYNSDTGWNLTDIDTTLVRAFSEEAFDNSTTPTVAGLEIPEPGIYVLSYLNTKVYFPAIKPLDSSVIDIAYNDLSDRPFGDFTNRVIVGYPYVETSSAHNIYKFKGDSPEVQNTFYKLSIEYISVEDIIGAELTLSDGSTKVITDADIYAKNDSGSFWEIENLLVSNKDNVIFEITIGDYRYTDNGFSALGTYTSNYTGVYVTKIKLPDKTVKIDPKFLPEGGVGYTDGGIDHQIDKKYLPIMKSETRTMTYDGSGERIEIPEYGITFAKIMDEAIDLTKVDNVAYGYTNGTVLAIFTKNMCAIEEIDGAHIFIGSVGTDKIPLIISNNAPSVFGNQGIGTFVLDLYDDSSAVIEHTCVLSFDYEESVVDPKYLPDAYEVINLSDYGLKIAHMSMAESAEFCERVIAALEAGKPVYMKGDCEFPEGESTASCPDLICCMSGYQVLEDRYTISFVGTIPNSDGSMYSVNGVLIVENNTATVLFKANNTEENIDIFYATYDETTIAELEEAYQAGKGIYCTINMFDATIILPLVGRSTEDGNTRFVFCMSSGETVVSASCDNDEWSLEQKSISLDGLATEEYVDNAIENLATMDDVSNAIADLASNEYVDAAVEEVTPKLINLVDYEIGEDSLNDVILMSFASGGGSNSLPLDNTFWDDVTTDRPLRFAIDCTPMSSNYFIEVDGVTNIYKNNEGTKEGSQQISFSFNFYYNGYYSVKVILANLSSSTLVTVMTEPISIEGDQGDVFYATYGETTYSEIVAAFDAGKTIAVVYTLFGGVTLIASLIATADNGLAFVANVGTGGYEFTCNSSDEWSVTDITLGASDLPSHASRHGKDGDDPITPAMIGALPDTTVIPTVPTKVSAFENDAGYLTEHQSLDGLATETYVGEQISALVNSAPETLNTLNELAAALGNDKDFANTVAVELGKKTNSADLGALATKDTVEKTDLALDVQEALDESSVFYAEYGVATNAEIEAAYQAGKAVYVAMNGVNVPLYMRQSSTQHAFVGYVLGDDVRLGIGICENDVWITHELFPVSAAHATTHATNGDDPISPIDIGALPNTTTLADLADDSTHRTVTDAEKEAWNAKVDKIDGKGLSTNDYTDSDKSKLSAIEEGANKTVIDTTLTVSGAAADAKAVGDKIAPAIKPLNNFQLTMPTTGNYNSIVYANDMFVAVGNTGNIIYSNDGIEWTEATSISTSSEYRAVVYGNGTFVAGGTNLFVYSNDGVTWSKSSTTISATITSIAYGNGIFAATSMSNKAFYSIDGINWETVELPTSQSYYGVTFADGKFVAAGCYTDIIYSSDGIEWVASGALSSGYFFSIAYGGGKFVVVGHSGYGAYSSDGTTWNTFKLPTSKRYYGVTYSDNRFVAVGENSIAAYSADGVTWETTVLPGDSTYKSIIYGDGEFITVGENGAIAYSTDGIAWTDQFSGFLTLDGKDVTADILALIPTPDVSGQIEVHNIDGEAHNDIRELIAELQSFTETDPTVPAWAKAETKPGYTADEVGAVAYGAQTLTDEQKAQARTNIDAASNTDFTLLQDDLANNYYTNTEIDEMEFITSDVIDEICGQAIYGASEVQY